MHERQLEYVLAVAEELHFGRAAHRLHLAQPSLSQQVMAVEKSLGVTLFDRSTRQVELTAAGTAFVPHARLALVAIQRARRAAQDAAAGRSGYLAVGFAGSTTHGLLPRVIREYRRRRPQVSLEIHNDLLTRSQVERLAAGTLDVGVLRPPVGDPRLSAERIGTEALVAALPADHPLATTEAVDPARLADEPFVSYPANGSSSHAAMIAVCNRAGFIPTVAQEATESHTLVSLVAAGMGVALVPRSMSRHPVEGVVYRPLTDPEATLELWMAWRTDDTSPALTEFLAVARTTPP